MGKVFYFLIFNFAFLICLPAAPPTRLVLLLDGVSYRDLQALQSGLTSTNTRGRPLQRQAFNEGWFPVSRLIATYPSISDPSWSAILGNPPPPGYQRTWFNTAENRLVTRNGVTSAAEYERQMTSQLDGPLGRLFSYLAPRTAFRRELHILSRDFLRTRDGPATYYALIHSTDTAQHLSGDILAMLRTLDETLRQLRDTCRARDGRELEILLLSDHGNNHARDGRRVAIGPFLKHAGYHLVKTLKDPCDLVLPTAGLESWIEIHNAPAATAALVPLLTRLEGVDLVTAPDPGHTNRFLVMNSSAERAVIDWNPAQNSFRYTPETGDPLGYQSVSETLARAGALDPAHFAPADAWLAATLDHRYPDALERIIHGHTRDVLNPATVLVSLKNGYVHCGWLTRRGVVLITSGGTHGALDHLNSTGILLSNFAPTSDTTTTRIAPLFENFPGRNLEKSRRDDR